MAKVSRIKSPRPWTIAKELYPEWAVPYIRRSFNVKDFEAVELSDTLLPKMTQAELAKYTIEARARNDFGNASMPVVQGTFAALYQGRNDAESQETVEEARVFIRDAIRKYYLNTLTRIAFTPKGKDTVTHDFSMPTAQTVKANVVGPDEFIASSKNKAYLTAIAGTSDVEAYGWINGTDVFSYRLDSKPQSVVEAVAWLGADSAWAGLGCGGHPEYSNSSLGVRVVA